MDGKGFGHFDIDPQTQGLHEALNALNGAGRTGCFSAKHPTEEGFVAQVSIPPNDPLGAAQMVLAVLAQVVTVGLNTDSECLGFLDGVTQAAANLSRDVRSGRMREIRKRIAQAQTHAAAMADKAGQN